jgi:hypothetical protein
MGITIDFGHDVAKKIGNGEKQNSGAKNDGTKYGQIQRSYLASANEIATQQHHHKGGKQQIIIAVVALHGF